MANADRVVIDGASYGVGNVASVNGKTGDVVLNAADVGAKAVQSAVSSPERSGNSIQFIDTISQDEQGIITATKKQVQEATSTQAGILSSSKFREINTIRNLATSANALALAAYPTPTVSSAVASIPDGADGLPVKALVVDIEPIQAGSGTPSPTNVRAISGWTGVQISVNGDTIAVTFPSSAGTVYGGTLDVTNGVLTVDRAMVTIDENTSISISTSSHRAYTNSAVGKPVSGNGVVSDTLVSDYLPTVSVNAIYISNNTGVAISNTGTLNFNIPGVTNGDSFTVNDVKTYLASHNLHVVCGIEQVTYQLDPTEVLTLLGTNTIYADCGDVTVTYRADPTLYGASGQTEDDMTANTPIASGKYFQIGNTLYKATAAIATGETIVPGVNCSVTNIAEALNLLNA